MIKIDEQGIASLKNVLKKTDYELFCKVIRGLGDFLDPWYDFNSMKKIIEEKCPEFKNTFLLLQMGFPAKYQSLADEIGEKDLEGIISTGIWYRDGDMVETDNYVLLSYQGIRVVVEINPWYETCKNKHTDTYIGSDSLRLAENIQFDRGTTVLDLCSGSGIQGLLAAKSAKKVVSVEINPKTVPVTRFNIALNGFTDKIEVREGDLYSVLEAGEVFDYIYANPPFIPMLDTVKYPMCGTGGEDGLRVLRMILEGAPKHLSDKGEMIIFCECLGDKDRVFFDSEVQEFLNANNFDCTASQLSRGNCDYQIVRLAELTDLFDKDFDKVDFSNKMQAVYSKLGAEYLYDLIYKICPRNKDGKIRYIKLYNNWDVRDCVGRNEGISFKRDGSVFNVYKDGKKISRINMEKAEELSYMLRQHSIFDTAKWLYPRYAKAKAFAKYGFPSYLQYLLNLCNTLEKANIIKRI